MSQWASKTYLVDVRLCASSSRNNVLDKSWNLGHNVHLVNSLTQGTLKDSINGFAVFRLSGPGELDSPWLSPLILDILLGLSVYSRVGRASSDDLVSLNKTTYVDNSRTVGRWGGVLHHDSRILWTLEVREVPLSSGVMWLHALKGVYKHGLALEINGALLGHNRPLTLVSWPESVSHGTPWSSWVGTVGGLSILADDKAWSLFSDSKLDDGLLVGHRLDGVRVAILGELNGAVVSVEIGLVLAEIDV